ncbi:MAG TPA: class D sortase [Candidatus Saccharimonadales bacterium]|nr:class D sortase [Candidatus Saccharimonadales bacterium]
MNRRAAAVALAAVAAALSLAANAPANPGTGTRFGSVLIPAIHLSMPLFEGEAKMCDGAETYALDRGVAHYPCSAFPWEIGTVFIAGHRTTHVAPFRHLNQLKKGYVISVRTRRGTFVYSVSRMEIVRPWMSFNPEVPGRLMLSTCYPAGSDAYRLVVFAKLVKTPKGV